MADVVAILPAAGRGRRFGGPQNKVRLELCGHPVWLHSVRQLRSLADIGPILLAVSAEERPEWEAQYATLLDDWDVQLVTGGAERIDSVRACLTTLTEQNGDYVAIHDAARPCIEVELIERVIAAARADGAAIAARRVTGTLKRQSQSGDVVTVDRRNLWEAQTPQIFRKSILLDAYSRWRGRQATDDSQLVEWLGQPVTLVEGDAKNLKITTPDDIAVAEAILEKR